MDEYDDLCCYDGDPVHDGWVDFDYYMNTGELSEYFEDGEEEYSNDSENYIEDDDR